MSSAGPCMQKAKTIAKSRYHSITDLSFGSQLNKTVKSLLSRRSFQGMSSSSGLRLMAFILSSKLVDLAPGKEMKEGTESRVSIRQNVSQPCKPLP